MKTDKNIYLLGISSSCAVRGVLITLLPDWSSVPSRDVETASPKHRQTSAEKHALSFFADVSAVENDIRKKTNKLAVWLVL